MSADSAELAGPKDDSSPSPADKDSLSSEPAEEEGSEGRSDNSDSDRADGPFSLVSLSSPYCDGSRVEKCVSRHAQFCDL